MGTSTRNRNICEKSKSRTYIEEFVIDAQSTLAKIGTELISKALRLKENKI